MLKEPKAVVEDANSSAQYSYYQSGATFINGAKVQKQT